MKISQIENIGVKFRERLEAQGICDQEDLLVQGKTPGNRKKLAETSDIHLKLLNKWVAEADLCRINGIGTEYAELLVECDIFSVQDLSEYKPEKLQKLLKEKNNLIHLIQSLPGEQMIDSWIKQAQTLPPKIQI